MANEEKKHGLPPSALIAAIVVAILFAALYALMLTHLVNLGQSKAFYLIALIPLAASSAAFLFHFADSSAEYVGDVWGGRLKLGGPVVVFFGIIILGLMLPPSRAFTQVVRLQLSTNQNDTIVGEVVLHLPTGPADVAVGEHNTAIFTGLARELAEQPVEISFNADDYELVEPGKHYTLSETKPIALPIKRDESPLVIQGYILSHADQQPIPGATISFNGQTLTTDEQGWFEVSLPPAVKARTIRLRINHTNFESKEVGVTAVRSDRPDLESAISNIRLEPKP